MAKKSSYVRGVSINFPFGIADLLTLDSKLILLCAFCLRSNLSSMNLHSVSAHKDSGQRLWERTILPIDTGPTPFRRHK